MPFRRRGASPNVIGKVTQYSGIALMSSLLTNLSALTALQSLNNTQANLQITQKQISTGLKVSTASDNAAYWSIAQSLSSDTGVLGAVNDSIAQSQSILGAATSALSNIATVINSIKTVLPEATNPGADISALNVSLASLGTELTSAVQGASYNGLNILDGSQTGTLNFVSGYNVSSSGVATFNNIGLAVQQLTGAGGVATTPTQPDITDATTIASLAALTTNGATAAFGTDAITATARSAGPPDSAPRTRPPTRLQALQTQQQLGVQSLSIANQSSQLILKLFQ